MSTLKNDAMFRYRWIIFLILSMAYFLVYFHRLSLPVVAADLARDFNAGAGVLGVLGSLYFYCYAVMQLPAGLLSDSLGPRKTVSGFLTLAAAGSLLFGMAPGIELAFVGRILVGFGVSMVFIPTMKILSQWFRPREFASMAGILNAVGGLGVLSGTWMLAVIAEKLGWRISFDLIGGATLVIAALAWWIVRDRPQDKGWPSIHAFSTAKGTSQPTPISLTQGVRRVAGEPRFWPVALWFFLDCGVFFGFGGLWGGPYLMHVYGMSKAEAGAVLSMIAWGMIIGSPFLGFVSDRILKSRKRVFIICTSGLVGVLALLRAYPDGLPISFLYGFFFLFSLFSSAIVVIGFTTTKELFPVEIAGTSVGTVNLFPFFGGAVFMPFMGKILEAYPVVRDGIYSLQAYRTMLTALLIAAGVAWMCTFFMKETSPFKEGEPTADAK